MGGGRGRREGERMKPKAGPMKTVKLIRL
jgi:hypothetical protein